MSEMISKSEVARRLSVSRQMVQKHVRKGMPVSPDGLIPWPAAKQWVEKNVISALSGSWAHRQAVRTLAPAAGRVRLTESDPVLQPADVPCRWCKTSAREYREHFFRSGAEQLLNRLRGLRSYVARLSLGMGLDAEQAFGSGELWELLLIYIGAGMISRDIEAVALDPIDQDEAKWADFIRESDVPFEPERWQKTAFEAFDRLFFPDDPPSGKGPKE